MALHSRWLASLAACDIPGAALQCKQLRDLHRSCPLKAFGLTCLQKILALCADPSLRQDWSAKGDRTARAAASPLIAVHNGECIGIALRVTAAGVLCIRRLAVEHDGKIDLSAVHAFGQNATFIASNPASGIVFARGPAGVQLPIAAFADIRENSSSGCQESTPTAVGKCCPHQARSG